MSYTSFGEFMRVLRVKNHEVMGDVARMLGVTVPFLSAVENGKKNVPIEWIDKIVEYYNLDDDMKKELIEVIDESKTQYKLITKNSSLNQRKVAFQFARSFDGMDDETAIRIMNLLKNKKEGSD
ncbi:helix-turn-helix domain-containing protein [Floccifex sp.]|uniref:helix-turn-helix domain-containing protein n=1 Tax=Floccifex sp. TaxID=2815810 RepID=UPI003EFC21A4